MAVFLNDHVKPEPGLMEAVKIVIKYEIQSLLSKLADAGEEYIVLTASTQDNSCGHIGSVKGEGFTKNSSFQLIKQEFLDFCTGDQKSQPETAQNSEKTQEENTPVKTENPQTNRARRRKSTPRCKSQPPEWQTQQELQYIQNYAMIDPSVTDPMNDNAEGIDSNNVLDLSEKHVGGYSYTLDCSNDSYSSNVLSSSSEISKYPSKEVSPKHNGILEEPIAYTWKEEKLPFGIAHESGASLVECINAIPQSYENYAKSSMAEVRFSNTQLKKRSENLGSIKLNRPLQQLSSQEGGMKVQKSRRKSKKTPVRIRKGLESGMSALNSVNQGEANDNQSKFSGDKVNSNGVISSSKVTDITDMKSAFQEMGNMAKCLICLKVLANKNNRTFHWRSHVGDKRYTCDICNKAFTHPSNMRSHRKIHTDEKPFPCDLCDRRFRRRDYLLQHLERFHYSTRPSETAHIENGTQDEPHTAQV